MDVIERHWDGSPTIVDSKFEEGLMIENTLVGIGTMIVDKDFLLDMYSIADELKTDRNLISLMTKISNMVNDYFYSKNKNEDSRQMTYANNEVTEDGLILGTRLSSLKGKNVALCSEKSIATYVILEKLYSIGSITRKPFFVLSKLKTNEEVGPHAFIMLNKECDDPTKHLLFDVENPTIVMDANGNRQTYVGLYSLTDEEYEDFVNNKSCSPKSLYEFYEGYREISDKRIYGNIREKEVKR